MAKPSKTTPSDDGPTVQVTFRIPEKWLYRADDIAEALSTDGIVLHRTDGFRAAMNAGFEKFEAKKAR